MIRNDYRRALIMLRALEKGYSGHVRLERRTLRGNMQFSITAPSGGELHAAILARKPGTYAAEDLGALGRDGRGQAGLNATFDPRNILGNDLDECPLSWLLALAGECIVTRAIGACSKQTRHCSAMAAFTTDTSAPEGEQLTATRSSNTGSTKQKNEQDS